MRPRLVVSAGSPSRPAPQIRIERLSLALGLGRCPLTPDAGSRTLAGSLWLISGSPVVLPPLTQVMKPSSSEFVGARCETDGASSRAKGAMAFATMKLSVPSWCRFRIAQRA